MPKDIDLKKDYVKCQKCLCFIHKDRILEGIMDNEYCPVCKNEIDTDEKDGKDEKED